MQGRNTDPVDLVSVGFAELWQAQRGLERDANWR